MLPFSIVVILGLLLCRVSSHPITASAGSDARLSKRDIYIDQLQRSWRGIDWYAAFDECEPEELAIIVEAHRMAVEMAAHPHGDPDGAYWFSAAWNRYFVSPNLVSGENGWKVCGSLANHL